MNEPNLNDPLQGLNPEIAAQLDQMRKTALAQAQGHAPTAPAPSLQAQAVPPIPMAAEPMPSEVQLPSAGRIPGIPKSVLIRQMVTKEIKVLSTLKDGARFDRVLTEILRGTVKQGPDPRDLVYWDRVFLFVWLRINSFRNGHLYHPVFACPFCKAQQQMEVDLRTLKVNDLSEDYREPFEIKLADADHIQLSMRLTTGRDEDEIDAYLAANPSLDPESESWFIRHALAITHVNGFQYPLEKKLEMLKSLSPADYMLIREFQDQYSFGIDIDVRTVCQNERCGRSLDVTLPFQGDFFIPQG